MLLRKIASFYQNQFLVEVTSVAQLRDLSSKLEAKEEAVENFVPSPKKGNALAEDRRAQMGLFVLGIIDPVNQLGDV